MTTATVTPDATQAAAQAGETELFKQSFSVSIPKTMDGVTKVFTNPDNTLNEKALLYCLRAGIKQVINNRVRQQATGKDEKGNPTFNVVDGVWDATSLVLQAPQRQILSQREKIQRNLEAQKMPQAVIDQMLAIFDKNVSADEAPTGDTVPEISDFVVVANAKGNLIMRQPKDEDEE